MYAATPQPASAQYGRYQQQSAMTASPGELTLMLYEGCVKFLKQSRIYLEDQDIEKASNTSIKAQKIISELMATLDMSFDISNNLYSLYDFILRLVVQSNIKKEASMLDEPIKMMSELRDTWQQAVKLNRQQSYGGMNAI
ncbi:MAG: flagellar export chaperone FliS [Oscillospiraceae bacterium]|jgi:flagellar protein FliS|nr:flagellar export chaperone FliS [Oscillospiraceae bacterium]